MLKLQKNNDDELLEEVREIEKQGPRVIRDQLLRGKVLDKQIEESCSSLKSKNDKGILKQALSGPVFKRYKMSDKFSNIVSPYFQRKYRNNDNLILKRTRGTKKREILSKAVKDFLENDEFSTVAPGAKAVITRNKIKERKRFLLDTLDNLYLKFKQHEQTLSITRSVFFKLKPFWIVHQTLSGRDTCLCKTHANMKYLLARLLEFKVIDNRCTQSFIESRVCDTFNKECYYGECSACKSKEAISANSNENTWYYKWVTRKETRPGAKQKMYTVQITSKIRIDCTLDALIIEFNTFILDFLIHEYFRIHQHRAIQIILNNLQPGQVYLVCDFSQNYECKRSEEIHSAHFGASKKQLSLQTGAYFYRIETSSDLLCTSFCSISEDLRHDAAAVWAHLSPILDYIKNNVPNFYAIHFQSDGPSTQYKNKTNFYLFLNYCKSKGLKYAIWNFTAAGHGKSCADGTGGTVKGLCDRAVTQGKDVITAEGMLDIINSSKKIKGFLVETKSIENIDAKVLLDLKAAPNTKKVHQLIWTKSNPDYLSLNNLSCSYCEYNHLYDYSCSHFSLKPNQWTPTQIKRKKKEVIHTSAEVPKKVATRKTKLKKK